MSSDLLETLDVDTRGEASASVIWMHGLGANMHDFEPIVPALRLPEELGVRFVLPNAPHRPVTINGGMVMRAWFDILELDFERQDERGIRESEEAIRRLIERERAIGVATEKIVLAGFSQGGAVALHTALRYPERLAGVVALSTSLPLEWSLDAEASEANRGLPIFLAHGEHDPLISVDLGRASRQALEQRGYRVEWHEYPMQHAVCPEEIDDIGAWLRSILA